jgi:hypothetical protein
MVTATAGLMIGLMAEIATSGDASDEPCDPTTSASRPPSSLDWEREIKAGSVIRMKVRDAERDWTTLTDPSWTDEELVVKPAGDQPKALFTWSSAGDTLRFPWTDIDRIDLKKGNYAGEGFIVGGLLGTGLAVASIAATEGPIGVEIYLAMAVVPAVTGAIMGSIRTKWTTIFCWETAPVPDSQEDY